jgi:hypothetical protein
MDPTADSLTDWLAVSLADVGTWAGKVKEAGESAWDWLTGIPPAILGTIKNPPKTKPGGRARPFTGIGKRGMSVSAGAEEEETLGVKDRILAEFETLPDELAAIFALIPPIGTAAFAGLGTAIGTALAGLRGQVGTDLGSLPTDLGGILNQLPGVGGLAFGNLGTVIGTATAGIRARIGTDFGAIPGLLRILLGGVPAQVGGIFGQIPGLISRLNLGGLISSIFSNWPIIVGNALGGIPGAIIGAFAGSNLAQSMFNAGASLLGNLISGISSMFPSLRTIADTAASIWSWFWPGSPVKEGPLVSWNDGSPGRELMTMLTGGIEAQTPALVAAAEQAAAATNAAMVLSGAIERTVLPRPSSSARSAFLGGEPVPVKQTTINGGLNLVTHNPAPEPQSSTLPRQLRKASAFLGTYGEDL